MSKDNTSCKQCGLCCHYLLDGVKKKCKFLMKTGTRTYCKIYRLESRLYRVLDVHADGTKIYCCKREDTTKHYEGCPINDRKEGKIE
jgi:hypothetical protein